MRNLVNALNIQHLSRQQYNLKLYWNSIWKLKYSKIHSDLSMWSSLFKFNLSSSRFLMIQFLILGSEAVFFLSIFASFSSQNGKYQKNLKNPKHFFLLSFSSAQVFLVPHARGCAEDKMSFFSESFHFSLQCALFLSFSLPPSLSLPLPIPMIYQIGKHYPFLPQTKNGEIFQLKFEKNW